MENKQKITSKKLLKVFTRMFWSITFIICSVYIGVLVLLYLMQDRIIFIPNKNVQYTPKNINMEYDDITLKTSDGLKLHAWFIPAENSKFTVLFCHGNAGNISHRLDTMQIFHRLNCNFFVFDYRGYGKSEGGISEAGLYRDAEAAWKYLTEEKKLPADKIIIVGRSLGGAIAAHLAKNHPPRALVLESAFSSVPDIGKDIYPIFPVGLLTRYKLETKEYVKEVKCPILVCHSPDDEIIPFKHSKRIYASALMPKQFVELNGSHNDCYFTYDETYKKAIKEFIESLLEPKPKALENKEPVKVNHVK